jgi:2-hydroxychromene-2-carboxylate isomerase
MSATIDYYHFLVSPWSYLAIGRFNDIAARHDATVHYKPIDVMSTFSNMGGQPLPKRHPSRLRYRMEELKRWSSYLDTPINLEPAHFPVNPSLASRMVLAAGNHGQGAGALSDAVLTAVWRDEKNITDPDTLLELATGCGLDAGILMKDAESDELADQFDRITREAHEADVFGSPTWVLAGEKFWGQDRLDFLDRSLARTPSGS